MDMEIEFGNNIDQITYLMDKQLRLQHRHCSMCKIRKADTKSLFDTNLCKSCQVHFCHYRGC